MSGYNDPQPPQDLWAAKLYQKHGLGEAPTMAQIEPKAKRLLGNRNTAFEGAELVLGRRVDARESTITSILLFGGSTSEKFGLLLMQKGIEKDERHRKSVDGSVEE